MVAFPQQITRTICIATYPALPNRKIRRMSPRTPPAGRGTRLHPCSQGLHHFPFMKIKKKSYFDKIRQSFGIEIESDKQVLRENKMTTQSGIFPTASQD